MCVNTVTYNQFLFHWPIFCSYLSLSPKSKHLVIDAEILFIGRMNFVSSKQQGQNTEDIVLKL